MSRVQYTTVALPGKMKICVISTASLLTPPVAYGGMELQSYLLVKSLEELGQVVTLVAKPGSYTPNGGLIAVDDEKQIPSRLGVGYDLYIDMSHDKTFSWAHRRERLPIIEQYQVMSLTGVGFNPVLISRGQRDGKFGGAPYPIIYQHIDLREYPVVTSGREGYFFTLAQIIEEKRIDWSIEVAKRAGVPLKIHGPQWGAPEYIRRLRESMAGHDDISLESDIGGAEKIATISRARGMLHFPGARGFCEAGSIITLEALACGTPVIVSDNGVHREYVTNGENGYVVETIEEAVEIIQSGKIDRIDPMVCRRSVEKYHYTFMGAEYLRLAERIQRGERWGTVPDM